MRPGAKRKITQKINRRVARGKALQIEPPSPQNPRGRFRKGALDDPRVRYNLWVTGYGEKDARRIPVDSRSPPEVRRFVVGEKTFQYLKRHFPNASGDFLAREITSMQEREPQWYKKERNPGWAEFHGAKMAEILSKRIAREQKMVRQQLDHLDSVYQMRDVLKAIQEGGGWASVRHRTQFGHLVRPEAQLQNPPVGRKGIPPRPASGPEVREALDRMVRRHLLSPQERALLKRIKKPADEKKGKETGKG